MPRLQGDSTSWIPTDQKDDFSIHNLPFGIFSTAQDASPRVGVRIGRVVLDLQHLEAPESEAFSALTQAKPTFSRDTLNDFAKLGRGVHKSVRECLQDILVKDTNWPAVLKDHASRCKVLVDAKDVEMHVPMRIGDYTDFYAGAHHAYSLGVMFRGPDNAMQPNYYHLPVGYHGRASSVVVSGTKVRRPRGQILNADKKPVTAPAKKLDYELELGCFVVGGNELGESLSTREAEDKIFGYVLLNDWSARDIQQWEYVPLGPFNSKNFATTISPWVVLADALEGFRTEGIENPKLDEQQSYLRQEEQKAPMFNINLQVDISVDGGEHVTVGQTSAKNLVWSFPQMIAHHTLGGCAMNAGDLLGSGTISGLGDGERGSLIEMTKAGTKEIDVGSVKRTFLEDGDSVVMRGWCEKDGVRVGFGECEGRIEAARSR